MPTSNVISGRVYDTDGSTSIGADVVVFLYNKTKDEIVSGYDAGNSDLITDASGDYQGNLGNLTTQWEVDDIIFVSCRTGKKTGQARFLAESGGTTQNITLETLEPIMNVVKFLRMRMRDFNTSRNDTAKMVYPGYPRPNTKLTKDDDYPRVSLEKIDEETISAGITSNKSAKQVIRLKIKSVVWASKSDFQEFTIGDTSYSGSALLDMVSREVSDKLREGFYKRPRYTQDPQINDYYAYISDRNENIEYDEDLGLMINEIEIQFEYIRQS